MKNASKQTTRILALGKQENKEANCKKKTENEKERMLASELQEFWQLTKQEASRQVRKKASKRIASDPATTEA